METAGFIWFTQVIPRFKAEGEYNSTKFFQIRGICTLNLCEKDLKLSVKIFQATDWINTLVFQQVQLGLVSVLGVQLLLPGKGKKRTVSTENFKNILRYNKQLFDKVNEQKEVICRCRSIAEAKGKGK